MFLNINAGGKSEDNLTNNLNNSQQYFINVTQLFILSSSFSFFSVLIYSVTFVTKKEA